MEREKEIGKLVNVLRRTSRMALQSEWTGGAQDAAVYCVDQYNRVLARLKELDPSVATICDPLPAGSSLTVAAMACRQLAAYYEDETCSAGSGRAYAVNIDAESIKDSWRDIWEKSSREIEDLGEFIRESIDEWARRRKTKGEGGS
ncbi:MAG TPA: hypothetical protein VJH03_21100 [Blastocatellia bacterium]|nr:hypothetical protein [Blastocatellia bacterium]